MTAPTMLDMAVSAQTTTVELRIYGFGASGTTGTLRVQNTLVVNGSLY